MKAIVGLGNPGEAYHNTRHNVGFEVLESLRLIQGENLNHQNEDKQFEYKTKLQAEVAKISDLIMVKPQTYMNRSGIATQKILAYYRIKPVDLWVVHDDLDIKLGEYKIQFGKGPKVHNGVNSVEQALGTTDFWRVRVGIENRIEKVAGEEYVLKMFTESEQTIKKAVIRLIVEDLDQCLWRTAR